MYKNRPFLYMSEGDMYKKRVFLYISEATCKVFAVFFTCHVRVFLVRSRRVVALLCLVVRWN